MRILAIACSAAAALLVAPAAASASPANTTEFEITVSHDDLDLTTAQGINRLDERVRTRIRQLCRNGGRDGESLRLERACRTNAFAAARSEIRMAIAAANANKVRLASRNTPAAKSAPES